VVEELIIVMYARGGEFTKCTWWNLGL